MLIFVFVFVVGVGIGVVSASSAFAGASFANAFNEELLPFFFFKEEEEDDEEEEDEEEDDDDEDVCDGLLFSFFCDDAFEVVRRCVLRRRFCDDATLRGGS